MGAAWVARGPNRCAKALFTLYCSVALQRALNLATYDPLRDARFGGAARRVVSQSVGPMTLAAAARLRGFK